MELEEFKNSLEFDDNKCMLNLKKGSEGRILLRRGISHIATIVPGSLLGVEEEVVILGNKSFGYSFEEHTTWKKAACFVSGIQCDVSEQSTDMDGMYA